MSPVIFPDVELELTAYLRAQLVARGYDATKVSNKYGGGDDAVWIRRDGGPQDGPLLELARIGVNVYRAGSTDQQVSDLARLVSALLRGTPGSEGIKRVRQTSGPSPIPDTYPRRYMTFEVTVKGSDV